ncbi:hypothetical protein VOLCADRAFT_79562 [Volvox carteri f. nagariensis]|uniref:Phosphatidic acid phosphatase type 2/haloperoxidase domain-containing protein n=1 Tax=Volvox carteri f. nagariensis TaxID=3068 RepID=D8TLE7_VOLCA|nr:uncharacterized protein VOLCADRAFT_79562 [Volvox carteri f. nagariensis]EFJ51861.1 hypothetical protein VOLCADRAFT_79562 [Volvox carteri f. nagariensis]|eukprot:XP_002947271.1 hypothetical protein VOLCADRAFT_79562 [Volvox carteri f. nagariensis]
MTSGFATMRKLLEYNIDATRTGAVQHNWIVGLFVNGALVSAIVAFFIAQLSKVFTHYYREQVWDWTRLVSSGGMPSSHTALIIALTTAVAVQDGTDSSLFAMCLVISLIVMYDATGVRLHAGRQATVLNIIIAEMPPDHPVQDSGRLRDSLGHTPVQVAVGALLGVVVGLVVQSLFLHGSGGASGGLAASLAGALAPGLGEQEPPGGVLAAGGSVGGDFLSGGRGVNVGGAGGLVAPGELLSGFGRAAPVGAT